MAQKRSMHDILKDLDKNFLEMYKLDKQYWREHEKLVKKHEKLIKEFDKLK